jgi:hypothetical protein
MNKCTPCVPPKEKESPSPNQTVPELYFPKGTLLRCESNGLYRMVGETDEGKKALIRLDKGTIRTNPVGGIEAKHYEIVPCVQISKE